MASTVSSLSSAQENQGLQSLSSQREQLPHVPSEAKIVQSAQTTQAQPPKDTQPYQTCTTTPLTTTPPEHTESVMTSPQRDLHNRSLPREAKAESLSPEPEPEQSRQAKQARPDQRDASRVEFDTKGVQTAILDNQGSQSQTEEPPEKELKEEEFDAEASGKVLQETLRNMSVLISGMLGEMEDASPQAERRAASLVPRLPQLPFAAEGTGQVHVTLGAFSGVAEVSMLSCKLAGVCRQAPMTRLLEDDITSEKRQVGSSSRSLRLPMPATHLNSKLEVSVLTIVADASLVLHPNCSRYSLEMGSVLGASIKLDFRVSGHRSHAENTVKGERPGHPAVKAMTPHTQYVETLLQAAVRERPAEPYSFLASQLAALGTEVSSSESSAAQLELLAVEGLPRGSLLSVRTVGRRGGECRQARIHTSTSPMARLKLSAGLLLQVQVLVPSASSVLCLSAGQESYPVRLDGSGGHTMDLLLHVRPTFRPRSGSQAASTCMSAADSLICPGIAATQQTYLMQHGLLDFGKKLMHDLVKAAPAEPLVFLASCVEAKAAEMRARSRAAEKQAMFEPRTMECSQSASVLPH
eukprot:TRINITY_DN7232_c0_g1_i4.p1 TRINITY_DN7232_c0_g1~~TRINITY_DN7232_c0_g1_i4.p1  ORF type:complete len:581 (+),score=121.39 TRINITY_DN7232_c0_g1_i4:384-2126(+)